MTTQPSDSRFPWLAVVIAGFLALAGIGLLAFAVLSIANLPGAPTRTPTATAQPPTQAVAEVSATPVLIPTVTEAGQPAASDTPQSGTTSDATATPAPGSSDTAVAPTTEVPATTAPTADLNLKILQPANVRSGPGLVYPVIGGFQAGASTPVNGRDANGQWFAINYGAVVGWVSGAVSSYGGDVGALPVIAAPPTPVPTPVPPTNTPVPTSVPTNPPPVGYSSHGIVGDSFKVENTSAGVNDSVWFDFEVTNTSNTTVNYSALAGHTDQGYTAWSWTNQKLKPGQTLSWRDHISFDKTGTYQVYLGICYAGSVDACKSAGWDRLSPNWTVTIQ